ncbi:MAG: hypothetical protein ACJ75B_16625 [Flavisolibacter sp.]
MKKVLVTLICLSSLSAQSQSSKWFVSLSPGFQFGGPLVSVKKQVAAQGFNGSKSVDFFGTEFNSQFPQVEKGASFLVRVGKRINTYKSIYFTGGIASSGHITGFKPDGTYSNYILFGGNGGEWMVFKYKILQFGAGYEYSFPRSHIKLGVSPSIYLLHYSITPNLDQYDYKTSIVPGISGMVRLPLGKEKHLVGVDLIGEAGIAPPAKMSAGKESSFQPGSANMIHATVGLALSFRKS